MIWLPQNDHCMAAWSRCPMKWHLLYCCNFNSVTALNNSFHSYCYSAAEAQTWPSHFCDGKAFTYFMYQRHQLTVLLTQIRAKFAQFSSQSHHLPPDWLHVFITEINAQGSMRHVSLISGSWQTNNWCLPAARLSQLIGQISDQRMLRTCGCFNVLKIYGRFENVTTTTVWAFNIPRGRPIPEFPRIGGRCPIMGRRPITEKVATMAQRTTRTDRPLIVVD